MNYQIPDDIRSTIGNAGRIAIITHQNPDGDAIGSALGLSHYLLSAGKQVSVIVPDAIPEYLHFLPGVGQIIDHQSDATRSAEAIRNAEVLFVLDFSQTSRCGDVAPLLIDYTGFSVNIDHHPYPDERYSFLYHDTASSSTAELVFYFIQSLGLAPVINLETATCLYTGLVTDTGCFKYAVRPRTFSAARKLLRRGINMPMITSAIFDVNTPERLKLLGYVLNEKLVILPEYKTAYITLTDEEARQFSTQKGDTEGFVNQALSIKGTVLAAFFHEREPGKTKISFRSKGKFAANALSQEHFGGGGHLNAAGGSYDGAVEEAVKKFLDILPQYATALNS